MSGFVIGYAEVDAGEDEREVGEGGDEVDGESGWEVEGREEGREVSEEDSNVSEKV